MRKIFLIFHGRFPSEKAAALFAAKSAEAFADKDATVELIVPHRRGVTEDAFDFYSIQRNFSVVYASTIDWFGQAPAFIAFWASYTAFSISSVRHIVRISTADDIIYSNEALPLFLASFFRKNCFYEMHDFPESKLSLFGLFLSRMRWILVHNEWKKNRTLELFPKMRNRIIMERNAVDVAAFDIGVSQKEAREKLGLPQDGVLVLYTGHLYGWKGVNTLVDAAAMMPHGVSVALVGGTEADIEAMKGRAKGAANVSFFGHRPHVEMPLWQKAADVLVLPNTATEKISAFYTSPMKLFEYMASKKPIVATDLPSIREIVGEETATIVVPDDARALASGIELALVDPKRSAEKASKAYAWVADHTWNKRADRIISFIKKTS